MKSKNKLDFNSQESTEETNSYEYINTGFIKSQSEEISHKNMFDFLDIGIKLFPGAFPYSKIKSSEQNIFNGNNNINNNLSKDNNGKIQDKKDFECNNFLCKSNNNYIKSEQKNGLALAFDYYSSILERKIMKKIIKLYIYCIIKLYAF